MKPQDIIVLIKLQIWNKGRWTFASIADSVFLSQSETHAAIKRLAKASLFDTAQERPRVAEMEEFIIHGLKYAFPAELGAQTRGIPTAHSAKPMNELIIGKVGDAYVWPDAKGKIRGQSVAPLYPTAPQAALTDIHLYECLSLIDCLRVGKAREQALAKDELIKRMRV